MTQAPVYVSIMFLEDREVGVLHMVSGDTENNGSYEPFASGVVIRSARGVGQPLELAVILGAGGKRLLVHMSKCT